MIELREDNISTPVCPHCEVSITNVSFRELRGQMGRRYIYFCSACRKVLGVSHRKGFWMG